MINSLFIALVVIAVAMILLAEFGPGKKQKKYTAPVIQGATFRSRDGILELRVAADHPKLLEDLGLPRGTWISDIERNRLYRAECPVALQGNEMSDADVFDCAVELARGIGYQGKVRTA